MQDCYSDPADRDRQVIYIAAEALLDEMEAKDRRIEEEIGRANREHHRGFMMACGHLKEHANVHYADAAEMEIAALRKRIAELRDWNAGLAQESCIQQQRIKAIRKGPDMPEADGNSPVITDGCLWTYDDNDYKWDSACGESWTFIEDGPEENGVKFCQGCGKPVVIEVTQEEG